MVKTVCKSCNTSFLYEVIKELKTCPVCGKALWNKENKAEKNDLSDELEKADKSMMHVTDVHHQDSQMEGFIEIQCKKCLDFLLLDIEDAEIIKENYIKLKHGSNVECEECGYRHTSQYLTYHETISTAPSLPRCPVCNSAMLKKITAGNKFLAAATIGMYALPYNSKTFECKDCGYRF